MPARGGPGGPTGVTFTMALPVAFPKVPVAVALYVVVAAGVTVTAPFAGCAPTPLSILTDVAFVVAQESVELCPAEMLLGLAENCIVTPLFTVTVTVAV